jgi:hypothetical protein
VGPPTDGGVFGGNDDVVVAVVLVFVGEEFGVEVEVELDVEGRRGEDTGDT